MAKSDLRKLADCLYSLENDLDVKPSEWAISDGEYIAETMLDGYYKYITEDCVMTVFEPVKYDKSKMINKPAQSDKPEHDYDWLVVKKTPATLYGKEHAQPYIIATKNGCHCGIRGKDVTYYEYGTGLAGMTHKHPNASKVGWRYASGIYVTRAYWTGPQWYRSLVDSDAGQEYGLMHKPIWMYQGKAIMGVESGQFCYNAIKEYMGSLVSYDADTTRSGEIDVRKVRGKLRTASLSKQHVNYYIHNKIKNR